MFDSNYNYYIEVTIVVAIAAIFITAVEPTNTFDFVGSILANAYSRSRVGSEKKGYLVSYFPQKLREYHFLSEGRSCSPFNRMN